MPGTLRQSSVGPSVALASAASRRCRLKPVLVEQQASARGGACGLVRDGPGGPFQGERDGDGRHGHTVAAKAIRRVNSSGAPSR